MLQRMVRVEAHDKHGSLIEGARFNIYINGVFTASTEEGRGFATIHLDQPDADIRVEALYGKYRHDIRIAEDAHMIPIRFPEVEYVLDNPGSSQIPTWAYVVAVASGLFFLLKFQYKRRS
jgi:hypothetical protein